MLYYMYLKLGPTFLIIIGQREWWIFHGTKLNVYLNLLIQLKKNTTLSIKWQSPRIGISVLDDGPSNHLCGDSLGDSYCSSMLYGAVQRHKAVTAYLQKNSYWLLDFYSNTCILPSHKDTVRIQNNIQYVIFFINHFINYFYELSVPWAQRCYISELITRGRIVSKKLR